MTRTSYYLKHKEIEFTTISKISGFLKSLCPDFRLWPGLYDIYLCLRPKNWSVMLSEEKLDSVFTRVRFKGYVHFEGRLPVYL